MSYYVDNYVNNTQTFQINDARQLPIIVPSETEINELKKVFNRAIHIKKTTNDQESLRVIQEDLDRIVNAIYLIK